MLDVTEFAEPFFMLALIIVPTFCIALCIDWWTSHKKRSRQRIFNEFSFKLRDSYRNIPITYAVLSDHENLREPIEHSIVASLRLFYSAYTLAQSLDHSSQDEWRLLRREQQKELEKPIYGELWPLVQDYFMSDSTFVTTVSTMLALARFSPNKMPPSPGQVLLSMLHNSTHLVYAIKSLEDPSYKYEFNSNSSWESLAVDVENQLRQPGLLKLWPSIQPSLVDNPAFVAYVNQLLSTQPD